MAAGTSCLGILIVMITFAANFPQTSEALSCYCDDCDGSSLCVEQEDGGACYSKVTLMDGEIQRQKRCYDPVTAQQLCNLPKTDIFVVECCYNDYCNLNLQPSLPTSNSTTTTQTTTSTTIIDQHLNPEPNEHDKENKPDELVIKPPLDCYRLNSKRTSLVTQCTANYFGSCYHLIRKSSTGDVLYEVYGCADECVEEKRNRAVKTCCNTTLCNIVKDGPDNPSAPSTATEPSQFVSPTAVLNLLSVTASVELLSSSVQLLAPEGQGWTITEVKTTSTSIMSTNLNPSTKSRSHPASMETTTSTSELTSTTTTILYSTSTPSSLESSSESSFSSLMYILASVILGIIYVIAMAVVVMLTAVVCVAQKRRKSEAENKKIKRSTDTLMSVSV